MRILIDLQGCQTASRHRGIGRYSGALAQAMARNAGEHEVRLALNASFPETIPQIRRNFGGLVAKEHMYIFDVPSPVAQVCRENAWRVQAAELLREEFIHRINADVVHLSSLFEGAADDAVASVGRLRDGERTAVTLYDFIMLELSDRFLADQNWRRWYYRKLQSLKNAGILLGISQFSCDEAISRLGIPGDRVVNISSAVDSRFKRIEISPDREREMRHRYGLTKPFLMTIGSADPHKNIEGLINAFALLSPHIRNGHQLAIVFGIPDRDRERLTTIARRTGLKPDQLVFTGRVSDVELVELYNLAVLYVLPSFIEGFGLPAVEAMACGLPAIGSNRSSVPEAIARPDALFDPFLPASIAEMITQVLTDKGFRQSLIDHGSRHARSFSWDATAKRAIAGLEALQDRQASPRSTIACRALKPMLALLTPSNVSWRDHENLLAGLAGVFDVELICDEPIAASTWVAEVFRRRPVAWLDDHNGRYQRIVYLFENAEIALLQLERIALRPGTVIIHRRVEGNPDPDERSTIGAETLRKLAYSTGGYAALVRLESDSTPANYAVDLAAQEIAEQAGGVILLGGTEWAPQPDQGYEADSWCTWVPTFPRSIAGRGESIGGPAFDAHLVNEAIQRYAAHHPKLQRNALLRKIAENPENAAPTGHDISLVASALARQEPSRTCKFYLDISMFAVNDNKSGIHRVVRNIVRELTTDPPKGIRIETVREQDGVFRTACAATCALLDIPPPFAEESVVELKQGDILLGLDLTADRLLPLRDLLTRLRGRGVEIWFVVYDVLPVECPQWFPPEITSWFAPWLETVLECADGIVCISNAVAVEMRRFLEANPPRNGNEPRVEFFHLGAEVLSITAEEDIIPAGAGDVLRKLAARPSFLMVGTLEPRKGHEVALDAFEQLWKSGADINLVIVGPQGWKVEALVEKLARHRERDCRLFWLGRISDAYLNAVYSESSALIAASRGEGFGLPIVEAALHGKPVIASDIPVFREVAGAMASVVFFPVGSAEGLSAAIRTAIERKAELEQSAVAGKSWLTWADSARQIARVILGVASGEPPQHSATAEALPQRLSRQGLSASSDIDVKLKKYPKCSSGSESF